MDNDNNLDEEENQLIIIDGEKWTVHMDEQTGKHFLFNGIETKWATDEEETFFQRQIIAAIDDHKHIEHILDEDSVENSSKRNTFNKKTY